MGKLTFNALLYFRGSASAGMADKIALKNTYNFSVPRGVSLLRNIQLPKKEPKRTNQIII